MGMSVESVSVILWMVGLLGCIGGKGLLEGGVG